MKTELLKIDLRQRHKVQQTLDYREQQFTKTVIQTDSPRILQSGGSDS